jgi:hypothetical protein
VARRNSVPRARCSRPACLSAARVRTTDTSRFATECGLVVGLRDKRMAGQRVFLAALYDEFQRPAAIPIDVPGSDALRGAINHYVGLSEQIVETSGNIEPGVTHRRHGVRRGAEQAKPLAEDRSRSPIGYDVADARETHVVLNHHRPGDAFADHTVTIHCNANPVLHRHAS